VIIYTQTFPFYFLYLVSDHASKLLTCLFLLKLPYTHSRLKTYTQSIKYIIVNSTNNIVLQKDWQNLQNLINFNQYILLHVLLLPPLLLVYYNTHLTAFSRTTWVSWYHKGKASLDLNEARDDRVLGWQWHQLDHTQTICTSLQTDLHTNTSSHKFYRPDALPDAQPTVPEH